MRGSNKKQVHNWATPPWVIRALEARFCRSFGVDLCAESWSAKAPVYFHKGGPDVFTADLSEHLAAPLWCNMPYDDHGRWMALCRRLALHGHTVAALPQAGVGTDWWRESVERPEGAPRGFRKTWLALENEDGMDRGGWLRSEIYARLVVEVCFPKRIDFLAPPDWEGEKHGPSFQNAVVIFRPPAEVADDTRQLSLLVAG